MLKLAKALLALALVHAAPALACSVADGYRIPTNFELVQEAELIVVGRIVSGPDEATGIEPQVLIEPVRVLKGTVPPAPLMLIGALRWNGRDIPSAPTSLR